jgi:hypothetical protein
MDVTSYILSKKYTNERVTELTGLDMTSVNGKMNELEANVDTLSAEMAQKVSSINGIRPDADGNVAIEISGGGTVETKKDIVQSDYSTLVNVTLTPITGGYEPNLVDTAATFGWAVIDTTYKEVTWTLRSGSAFFIIGADIPNGKATAFSLASGTQGRLIEISSKTAYTQLKAYDSTLTIPAAGDIIKVIVSGTTVTVKTKKPAATDFTVWTTFDMSLYPTASFNIKPCFGVVVVAPSQKSTYLNAYLGSDTGQTAVKEKIYLIGHFGQSNADGRAAGTKPSGISNKVYLVKNSSGTAVLTNGDAFNDNASSSAWFAHGLNLLSGKNIAIAKYAVGGTQLVTKTAASWNPATTGTSYYTTALQTYQLAVTALENAGYTVVKTGFVWTQGESDGDANRTTAEYKQALKDLISAFRTDLGVTDFKCFINELGMNNISPYDDTAYGRIRIAQNEVAVEDTNCYMVSDLPKKYLPSKLNYMLDQWHYTADGYILMGKQGAEYVHKNLFNPMYIPQYKLDVDRNFIESLYA